VPAREFGILLWLLVLPVPYVDCTDAYRLRRRGGRVAIALAGPAVDLTLAGGWGLVARTGDGAVAATAYQLMLVQLLILATNLNPVLPTDGHQAIETVTGEMNFRTRALSYIGHRLLRLPLPTALTGLSGTRRTVYVGYVAVALLYTGAVFGLIGVRLWGNQA
jgi:putative peptide zinc metalloprotease protein